MDSFPSHSTSSDSFESSLASIRGFLSTVDSSTFNICAYLYKYIKDAEDEVQPKLFEAVALMYEDIESNEEVQITASPYENQEDSLEAQFGTLVNSFLDFYIKQHLRSLTFYTKLWETIQSDLFFPDEAAKTFAFYYILIDKRIPYFELIDGYQMSNESFKILRRKHSERLRKIRYINSIQFSQKTEHASLILNELGIALPESDASVEIINRYEEKLILMVETLSFFRSKEEAIEKFLHKT